MARIEWKPIVERAAEIAGAYSTKVTLRQLFYRLVSAELLTNNVNAYKSLSAQTAQARREGWFPALLDQGREIHGLYSWMDPSQAVTSLAQQYRRDRTEGQDKTVWMVLEKATLIEQVIEWVDGYGLPVVALRGYGSQTIIDDIRDAIDGESRSAIALYLGDLDPTGEDIERDLQDRTDWCFDEIRRLAVNHDQIAEFGLVPNPGKASDTRAAGFVAKYGELIQVEVEAIDPATLEGLVRDAVETFIDFSELNRVRAVEDRERALLREAAHQLAELSA